MSIPLHQRQQDAEAFLNGQRAALKGSGDMGDAAAKEDAAIEVSLAIPEDLIFGLARSPIVLAARVHYFS